MKVFNTKQIRAWDEASIQEEGIRSSQLMERAANACLRWIQDHFVLRQSFLIICGMGNNGGDGLALTRLLLNRGFPAKALILKHSAHFSEDAALNVERLHKLEPTAISYLTEQDVLEEITENAVLIDAVFGTGINRPIEGWVKDVIEKFNNLPNKKIAIDCPSGLMADCLPQKEAAIFKVDNTLSFQTYKRSFLHPESMPYAGRIILLDIGLSGNFEQRTDCKYQTIDLPLLRSFFKERKPFSHKGTYGNAVLIGGSYGMIGAIMMATQGALRSGVGKVWVQAPSCGYGILQSLCPEALFLTGGAQFITEITPEEKQTIGIGPGLGTHPETKAALSDFLEKTEEPLILDADALNIIAADREKLLDKIPSESILTPHPGEFKKLFGREDNSMEALRKGLKEAQARNIIIVLKGHRTAVLLPDGICFYNLTGNSGMSKGGSGDVLTGIITSLKAQGYSAAEAAILGVWLHGRAGDFAAQRLSMESMTAMDVCRFLGDAFKELYPEEVRF